MVVYNVGMTKVQDKPKARHWRQFSLTTLLVVTTICAILFAWWRDRTELQQQLKMELRRAAMERDRAIEAHVIARKSEEMARLRVENARAALLEATSQARLSQEAGVDD